MLKQQQRSGSTWYHGPETLTPVQAWPGIRLTVTQFPFSASCLLPAKADE